MHCNQRHCLSMGFTLIEVLIAMTLLSVMVALLFSSMKISATSWQAGEEKISKVNETAVVYQFFQRHLSVAKPLWNDFKSGEARTMGFQGRHEDIQFVSSFPASAKKAGLQVFNIKLMSEGKKNYLQASIKPFYPATEGEEWNDEEVTVLPHVRKFTLSYYGSEGYDPALQTSWVDEWADREVQPRLVKIKIEREDGSYWPEMVVEIKNIGIPPGLDGQMTDEDRAAAEAAQLQTQQQGIESPPEEFGGQQ